MNTALTRGTPMVRIGVIHPIESYWLHFGPEEQNALALDALEYNFEHINKWLSFGGYDFDYICETTLPELANDAVLPQLHPGRQSQQVLPCGCTVFL